MRKRGQVNTNFINARGRWTGHLCQSRFASVLLDDDHLVRAVRYVDLNPLRARLAGTPAEWPWSSARAHLSGSDDALADPLVRVETVLARIPHLPALLRASIQDDYTDLRRAESTGRPLGTDDFVTGLKHMLGRTIARRSPGRKAINEIHSTNQLNLL